MNTHARDRDRAHVRRIASLTGVAAAALLLAACGSTSGGLYGGSGTVAHPVAGQSLSTSTATGAGSVVVDARGRTTYVLLDAAHRDLACTSASGCAAVWVPVQVPATASAPTAGAGLLATLVGASTGQATYRGWKLYEYTGDTASGQANGVGVASFGGTWYALRSSGAPVGTTTTAAGASGW